MKNIIFLSSLFLLVSACKKEEVPCTIVCETTVDVPARQLEANNNCECQCINTYLTKIEIDHKLFCMTQNEISSHLYYSSDTLDVCFGKGPLSIYKTDVIHGEGNTFFLKYFAMGDEAWILTSQSNVEPNLYITSSPIIFPYYCDAGEFFYGAELRFNNDNFYNLTIIKYNSEIDALNHLDPISSYDLVFRPLEIE